MSVSQLASKIETEIFYPESDGKPMADNTKQFELITDIVQNLRTWYQNEPNVFIAGDLLWYPIEKENKTAKAPDIMVVFGRPKGYRGSYKQWLEDDIAPQVVFEIRSPGNQETEMEEKFQFYQTHQVEEYYLYDPDKGQLKGWLRGTNQLHSIVPMNGWKSPKLGIRFELINKELYLYHPDGSRFTSHTEERNARQAEKQRADIAEAKLARLQSLLAQKGISLNDNEV
jgi:Uma2 family endonuclease